MPKVMEDSTGRGVNLPEGMNPQQILSMLGSTMKGPANKKMLDKKSPEDKESKTDSLLQLLIKTSTTNSDKIEAELQKTSEMIKEAVGLRTKTPNKTNSSEPKPLTMQNFTAGLANFFGGFNFKQAGQVNKNFLKDGGSDHKIDQMQLKNLPLASQFYKEGLSKNCISMRLSEEQFATILGAIGTKTVDTKTAMGIVAASGAGGKGGSGTPPPTGAGASGNAGTNKFPGKIALEAGIFAAGKLLGSFSILDHLLEGAVTGAESFREDMNQIALQTQGVNGEMKELQDQWLQVGNIVDETGRSLADFQKKLPGLMKKGNKGFQDEVKLLKTSLALSTRIGSNEEQTAELFHDMSMSLGMSNTEMAQLSRGIQGVALFTGVTGDNLLNVVKSSDRFLKSLRNAGTLTAEVATNFIQIQAAAEKNGVGESVAELTDAMTSSANFYFKSSQQTKNLLLAVTSNVEKTDKLLDGMFGRTKEDMRDAAKGMEKLLVTYTGKDSKHLNELTPAELNRANLSLEKAFSKSAGELSLVAKTWMEGSKSFGDSLKDVTDELNKGNLSDKRKNELEIKRDKLKVDNGLQFLTAFYKQMDVAGTTFEGAVTRAGQSLGPEFDKGLDKPIDKMQDMLNQTAEGIKGRGGEDFGPQIAAALKSKDKVGLQNLIDKMSEEYTKLGIKEAKSTDPITAAQDRIMHVNEEIRKMTDKHLLHIIDLLGEKGIIAIGLAALLIPLASLIKSVVDIAGFLGAGKIIGGIAKAPGKMMGMLGKAAAPAATLGLKPNSIGMTGKIGQGAMAGEGAAAAVSGGASEGAAVSGGALATEGAATAASGALSSLAIVLGLITIAIGSMTGAMKAGEHAAQIFGLTQDQFVKKTLDEQSAMKYSAEAAGALTGVLNMLTLGLFSAELGAEGTWTKAIAKWDYTIGILSAVLKPVLIIFDMFWNLLKGLWKEVETFWAGLSKEVMPALDELWKSLQELWAALQPLMPAIKFIGTLIGIWLLQPFLYAIGMIAAGIVILKAVISALIPIIKAVVGIITGIIQVITGVIKVLYSFWQILSGIVTTFVGLIIGLTTGNWSVFAKGIEDITAGFKTLWNGVKDFFWGIVKIIGSFVEGSVTAIINLVASLIGSIIDWCKWLYKVIVGNSIVPDLILGIIKWFAMLPVKIIMFLGNLLVKMVKFFSFDLPKKIIEGLMKIFPSLSKPIQAIIDLFSSIVTNIKNIFGGIIDVIVGIFTLNGSKIWQGLTKIFGGIWKLVSDTFIGIVGVISAFVLSIPEMVGKFITDLVNGIVDWFKWLYDVLIGHSLIPDLIMDILKALTDFALKAVTQFIQLGQKIVASIADFIIGIITTLTTSIPKIATAFVDMFLAVLKSIGENVLKISTALGDLIVKAITGATSAAAGLGDWVYNTLTIAMQKVWDWLVDKIPGASTVKAGAAAVGGAWNSVKSTASSAWEGTKKTANSLWEGTKSAGGAVLGAINPMNWFEDGTKSVTEGGAAMLHKGEVIIPADMLAKGNGPYDNVAGTAANDLAENGKLTNTAIPMASRGESAIMPMASDVSVANTDLADKVGNNRTGTSAEAQPSKEMAKIAEATADTAEGIEDLHSSIRELIEIMRSAMSPTSSSSKAGSSNGKMANSQDNNPKGPRFNLDGLWPDSQGFRSPDKALMGSPG